jgi:MYXO-CTERM domain-containing protein
MTSLNSKNTLRWMPLAAVLFVTPLSTVFAQTAADVPMVDSPATTDNRNTTGETRRGFDWGWLGLLGLVGLAGMSRKHEQTVRYPETDTSPRRV